MRRTMQWMMALVAATLLAMPLVAFADVEEDVDDLNDRVDEIELKTAKNKVSFFGDFRVRYDYQKWHVNPYNQLAGFDFTNADAQTGPPVPVYMPKDAQQFQNDEAYSARLRLKMDYRFSNKIHFSGRLGMYRQYGGPGVHLFNGFPNTVKSDFNSVNVPTNDSVHVERAALTWYFGNFFLTAGRQAATGGPPRQFRENKVRQGTPNALMIDAQIDGFMLGWKMKSIGLPEASAFRLCYGTGFESGFGSGGLTGTTFVNLYMPDVNDISASGLPNSREFTVPVSDLKDSKVAGFCAETPIPAFGGRESNLSISYFRLMDMIDIPYGLTRGFPNSFSTQNTTLTATANLGDMDLSALAEGLLESELFGHVRGAFTGAVADKRGLFEVADGGTLFLDEVGDMSTKLQTKLLRVLEQKQFERVGSTDPITVDVRVVAATNRDPRTAIKAGEFREDLYYRLNAIQIRLPALRDRVEDIPLLVERFLADLNEIHGRGVAGISARALDLLQGYRWPGNIRELRNSIEFAYVCASGGRIERQDLPETILSPEPENGDAALLAVEVGDSHDRIRAAMERHLGNRRRVAQELGISRTTLWRRLKEMGSIG